MSPSAATAASNARPAAVKGNGIRSTGVHATSSDQAVRYEHDFAAHNYHPLPVVMARGEGVHVWDPEVRFVISACGFVVGFDKVEGC